MPREGFQSTCTDCVLCDYKNSIVSFPLDTTVSVSESRYDEISEPISMNFQWAARSVPPRFTVSQPGLIDEGTGGLGSGTTNTTTLNFNNMTYTLYSVQIVTSTHSKWIIPQASQGVNTEDIIITFRNLASSFAAYILIVLPILRGGTNQPYYIQGLASSNQPAPGTYSLSNCLPPSNAMFAYYVTCLNGYTERKKPDNAYVFIAVQGVPVASSLMASISDRIGPTPILPFSARFTTNNDIISQIGNGDFNKYVLSTRVLLASTGANVIKNPNERKDPTSSYKCVPLDPEKDVVDDTLSVDMTSGTLLSDVLAERKALMASTGTSNNPAKQKEIEIIFESIFGSIAAAILIAIIIYTVYSSTATPVPAAAVGAVPVAARPTGGVPSWMTGVGAAACIVIGIVVGMVIPKPI